MKLTLLVFISFLMLSCDSMRDDKSSVAYFGGEIDHPKNAYVYLKDSDGKRDTILLDSENRFMHKIENLNPGLYEFGHGGEFQIVVIEPEDSIALRLNTKDFDESLVYTGIGARKNNYLMKLFLKHESLDPKIIKSFSLEPEDFEKMLDSIARNELAEIENFNDNRENSQLFNSISEAYSKYNYYKYKELFPFGYYGNKRLIHFKDLPDGFYDFRKDVNLNNDELTELYVYRNYIFMYLNNVSLNEFYNENDHNVIFNNKSVAYNVEKLRLIDSLFKNEDIKNYLMRSVTKEYIVESENPARMQKVANAFLKLNENEKEREDIMAFLNSRINLRPGKQIPNITLLNYMNNEQNLHDMLNRPTLIYFWTSNRKIDARQSHGIVKRLKPEHPYLDFISINVNEYKSTFWKETLKDYKFSPENEYLFKNSMKAVQSLAVNIDNCILVDENGTILETNFGLYDGEVDKVLMQFSDDEYALK